MRYSTLREQDYGVRLPQSRLSDEMNQTAMTDANTIEPKYNSPLEEGAVVSNLPLLFANGHPTSLEKITLTQLERFVTFMVQCSLGHDTTEVISEPRWWPKEVKFSNPLTRPKKMSDNWMANLKKIVFRCYTYHRSEYLLRFCSYLARYPHEDLEYINNWDSTTSLYHKNTGKLLVTFRNENMNYDRRYESPRKKLLSCSGVVTSYCNKSKQQQHSITMVEPPTEDIYLCDNCDAQFIALDKMKEHERVCRCRQERNKGNSRAATPELPVVEPELRQDQFLEYFQLCSVKVESIPVETNDSATVNNNNDDNSNNNNNNNNNSNNSSSNDNNDNNNSSGIKRTSRRVRGSTNFARCSTIPFSSPAGILLAKKSKAMTEETQQERLERIERHLIAPVLSSSSRPKWLEAEVDHDRWIVTHKPNREKPGYDYVHQYQFGNSVKRKPMLSIQSQLLYIVCRPVCVLLTRVTEEQINHLTQNRLKYDGCLVENISVGNKELMTEDEEKASRQNISSKRKAPSDENDINTTERNEEEVNHNSEASNEKLTVSQGNNFCDHNYKTIIKSIKGRGLYPNPRLDAITVIDLCSSDEEDNPCTPESSDENRDPMNCMAEGVKKSLLQKLSSSKVNLKPHVHTTEQTREWLPNDSTALINDDAENYTNKHNVNVTRTCLSPVLRPAP